MSLSMQNHIVTHNLSNKVKDHLSFIQSSPSRLGHTKKFHFETSEIGSSNHTPEANLAIILLDPARNLKWRSTDADEHSVSCPAGTVFFIPAQHKLSITWPEPITYLSVTISTDPTKSDANHTGDSMPNAGIVRFSSKQCLQVCQIIMDVLQEDPIDENYLSSLHSVLENLIIRSALAAHTSGGIQSGLSAYACRQIDNYIKEHFRSPVSVPNMASFLGISAGHFATCFRESFGQTPHQYLMKLRLDEAERCLKDTDTPISEIAARLSFSSQSHLTTALRKYRHLTPGEIRRRGSHQRTRTFS